MKQELPRVHISDAINEGVLNRLTAIRAAAEILQDNDHLSARERNRFLSVIAAETMCLNKILASHLSCSEGERAHGFAVTHEHS